MTPTGGRRQASRLSAGVALAALVAGGLGCGSDDDRAAEPTAPLQPSSAPPTTDRPPLVRGDLVVTGLDPATRALLVASDTEHTLVVQPQSMIKVQGAEGPMRLPVEELGTWLERRLGELGTTAPGVTMHYEAELVDDTAEVTELAEVPPG